MAEATYLHDPDIVKFTAASAVAAGEVLQHGGEAVVNQGLNDAVTGDPIVARRRGVLTVTAASALTRSVGDTVGWDDTANEAVAGGAGDFDIGKARVAKTSGQTTIVVGLNE